ncbi:rho GTPase-activating protein 9-like isoform X1 [Maniola hyperantus]|uniref:rho GTPase-activating protein 9-like isoform X1 n=1 Tax=Aphantopus hyperantus TaxID=2795564 RepID=UPI003748DF99
MDKERKPIVRRPDVLRKLNAENLHFIERGLLGDLPDRFKPTPNYPVRGQSNELVVAKPSSLLSACLPVIPDNPSPISENQPFSIDDEEKSPLRKSFSFRDKFRLNFFNKERRESGDKPKWKTIVEEEKAKELNPSLPGQHSPSSEHDHKHHSRFWFFKHKATDKKSHSPIYTRSKSFEFLPRALEEGQERVRQKLTKNSLSYAFGSSDSVVDNISVESLEYIADVYSDKVNNVCLKSFKGLQDEDHYSSTTSTTNSVSASSGISINILKTESVQDLLDEFHKTVDLFSENYLSDCEPYTKTSKELTVQEKRKSSSFNLLPSPKIVQMTKVNEVSEDFKAELSKILEVKRDSQCPKSPRRGSVTDCFLLEDKKLPAAGKTLEVPTSEQNKYRRAQKKEARVRRISSTKYWITPEECELYSRERRPPLVIPRITQYRPPPRRDPRPQIPLYTEDRLQDVPDKSWNWSPTSERSRIDIARSFNKANCESPPFWAHKRLGGSTENLLTAARRPNHLQLPPSSSGDSLDVEVREREPGAKKERKSRSMVAPKQKPRPPVVPQRVLIHPPIEAPVIFEGPMKRTKFMEGGKKSKKNWTDCYMILTPTKLVFYKDQRSYDATRLPKPNNTPPSPTAPRAELELPLLNAHVVQCIQQHTRRFMRSLLLTVEHDQYLLQDFTEEGAIRLLKCIQNVIYKLGPPPLDDRPSPYQSSNTDLESLGRTPPVSRHATRSKQKAGGSSNEDLSDSTEVSIQRSHVRSRLRKFFAKRPAMDVLVKKGIYKDEPVFGRKLEEVCPASSPRVPDFVKACVKEIESSEENLSTDGLYRASGNLSQVQKIRLEIDQNNLSVIENNTDIHVLTGSLKLFFRELKEPLIPCTLFDRILAACSIKPRDARVKEFQSIIQALPQCNRDTLKFLLEHLLKVTQYSERNRMHTANLAIVFGPTLLWAPEEQKHNIAIDYIQQNNVVDILLNEFKDIFVEETKGKKKA